MDQTPTTRRQLRERATPTEKDKDDGKRQTSGAGSGDKSEKDTAGGSSGVKMRTRLSTGTLIMNGTSTQKDVRTPPSTPTSDSRTQKDNSSGGMKRRTAASTPAADSQPAVPPKQRRIARSDGQGGDQNDDYCWLCHKESCSLYCQLCPRGYHLKCLQLSSAPKDWVCVECNKCMRAECVETRSKAMAQISTDTLCLLMRYALDRMRQPGSEVFQKPVDSADLPFYSEFVVNPMDFSTLEKNIKKKEYGCTEAFLADAKWILHNCIIFNGVHHKLTVVARNVVKSCKHEMSEIEVCPQCYQHSCISSDTNWFIKPCEPPHTLVWAKLKGYPFWPAKALQEVNGQVDVRFFGAHDMSWIPFSQVFLLSEEPPTGMKSKKGGFANAVEEMEEHITIIKDKYGSFDYAPYRTPYDRRHVYMNNKLKCVNMMAAKRFKTATYGKHASRSKEAERVSAASKTASALKSKYNTIASKKSVSTLGQGQGRQHQLLHQSPVKSDSSPDTPAEKNITKTGSTGVSKSLFTTTVSVMDLIRDKILQQKELEEEGVDVVVLDEEAWKGVEDHKTRKDIDKKVVSEEDSDEPPAAAEKHGVAKVASEKDSDGPPAAEKHGVAKVASEKDSGGPAAAEKHGVAKVASEKDSGGPAAAEKHGVAKVASEKDSDGPPAAEKHGVAKVASEKDSGGPAAAEKHGVAKVASEKDSDGPAAAEKHGVAKVASEKDVSEIVANSEDAGEVVRKLGNGSEKPKEDCKNKQTGGKPAQDEVDKLDGESDFSDDSTDVVTGVEITTDDESSGEESVPVSQRTSTAAKTTVGENKKTPVEKTAESVEETVSSTEKALPSDKSETDTDKNVRSVQETDASVEKTGAPARKTVVQSDEKMLSSNTTSSEKAVSDLSVLGTDKELTPKAADTKDKSKTLTTEKEHQLSVVQPSTPPPTTSNSESVSEQISPQSGVEYKESLMKTIEACKGKLGITNVEEIEEAMEITDDENSVDSKANGGDVEVSDDVKGTGEKNQNDIKTGAEQIREKPTEVSKAAKDRINTQKDSDMNSKESVNDTSDLHEASSTAGVSEDHMKVTVPKTSDCFKPAGKPDSVLVKLSSSGRDLAKDANKTPQSQAGVVGIDLPEARDRLQETVSPASSSHSSSVTHTTRKSETAGASSATGLSVKIVAPKKSISGSAKAVSELPKLVVQSPILILESPKPVSESSQPVVQSPVPVSESSKPVSESSRPVAQLPIPVSGLPKTVSESSKPVVQSIKSVPSAGNDSSKSVASVTRSSNFIKGPSPVVKLTRILTEPRIKLDSLVRPAKPVSVTVNQCLSQKANTVKETTKTASSTSIVWSKSASAHQTSKNKPITIDDDNEPGLLMEVESETDNDALIIDLDEDDLDLNEGGPGASPQSNSQEFLKELAPSPAVVESLKRPGESILRKQLAGAVKKPKKKKSAAHPSPLPVSSSSVTTSPSAVTASSAPCVMIDVRSLSGLEHAWKDSEKEKSSSALAQKSTPPQPQSHSSTATNTTRPCRSHEFRIPATPSTESSKRTSSSPGQRTSLESRSPGSGSGDGVERATGEEEALKPAAVSLVNKYSQQIVGNMQLQLAEMSKELLATAPDEKEIDCRLQELKEQLQWNHEQQVAEIQHNFKMTLAEMKACWEAEKSKALSDQKKNLAKEKIYAVIETKKKQWCASCWKEALYYCCWNTSYCSYACQQRHWTHHQVDCRQSVDGVNAGGDAVSTSDVSTTKSVESDMQAMSGKSGSVSTGDKEERIQAQFNLPNPQAGQATGLQGDEAWRSRLPPQGLGQNIQFLPNQVLLQQGNQAQQPPPPTQPLQQLQYLHSLGSAPATFQPNSQVQLLTHRPALNTVLPTGTVLPSNTMVFPILRTSQSQPASLPGTQNVVINRPMHYQPMWKNC